MNKDLEDTLVITGATAAGTGVLVSIYGGSTETLGGDSGEVSISASENPEMTIAASLVVSSIATSSGGPDAVIEVFFKNQVPYTVTEKKAEQVYGAIHGERQKALEKPVLIAESREAMETASEAFCNTHGNGIVDQLELFEELLENVADNQKVS